MEMTASSEQQNLTTNEMKFKFKTAKNVYEVDTAIRMLDDQKGLQLYDTTVLLGERHVTNYRKENGNQIVELSNGGSIFSSSLLSSDGKSVRLVIDRRAGIINPYVTINNWSVRQTEKKGNNVIVTSKEYPGPIDDLPDFIPIETTTSKTTASASTARNSVQEPRTTSSTAKDLGLIAAASILASVVDQGDKSKDKIPNYSPSSTFSRGGDSRSSLISDLRSHVT